MANTKITSRVIADNAVGISALNVSDGSDGQVLTTNGSGTLSFADGGVAGITSSADATAITIDSSENVGIGVTPAAWKTSGAEKVLQIDTASLYNNSDNNVYLNSNWFLNSSGQNVYIESDFATSFAQVAGNHIWYGAASGTAGNTATLSERMRIDTSGNLLVGKTTVGVGNAGIELRANNMAAISRSGDNVLYLNRRGSDGVLARMVNDGVVVGGINVSGSSTSYNTSSDYRLKENVDYDFTALDRVAQLKPARFNFIADETNTLVDGFIAHEVQDIVPEAISGEKDAVREEEYEITPAVLDDDGNVVTEAEMGTREVPDYQGIDQSKLVPLLTKAIQEQQTQIETLKQEIREIREGG